MMLCGCGPSAKELAEQQARQRSFQEFKQAVAAVKVCTQGATYREFREKELALATSYAANQSALADKTNAISQLVLVMQATDCMWDLKNQIQAQFPYFHPDESRKYEMAMAIKTIAKGSGLTYDQIKAEGGYPNNYIQHGLTLISSECDDLLK